jgi:hypothetical protein
MQIGGMRRCVSECWTPARSQSTALALIQLKSCGGYSRRHGYEYLESPNLAELTVWPDAKGATQMLFLQTAKYG